MVEVGFPFSDPVADGPTIQASNMVSLGHGMSVDVLFRQLETLREHVSIPVLLMGYLNPVEQFGVERFLARASECGIDALIVPDMPFDEYRVRYRSLFHKYGLKPVFLVTSRTEESRIRELDAEEPAFLYVVSSDAITGSRAHISEQQGAFFRWLRELNLKSKLIVGFGVTDKESFENVTQHTHGAIVGSAFVRALAELASVSGGGPSAPEALEHRVLEFVAQYR
jgi:tryptophan synthase alpha chain